MMRKGTALQIMHKWFCLIAWIAWGVGIVLTALSRFLLLDHDFFFRIVDPYVSTVFVLSIIPIGPIMFVGIVAQALRILFVGSIIIWILFIVLFVAWTGGV